ncbi:MAG: hypothetical protein MHPSP_000732, partial [Paramarteilia canceri]
MSLNSAGITLQRQQPSDKGEQQGRFSALSALSAKQNDKQTTPGQDLFRFMKQSSDRTIKSSSAENVNNPRNLQSRSTEDLRPKS